MQWAMQLLVVPGLIALNAFFVAAEYAIVAVRNAQVEIMRQRGWTSAARAMDALKADTQSAIGATQIYITIVSLLLGALAEPAMGAMLETAMHPVMRILPDHVAHVVTVGIAFAVVTTLTVVLGELLPKALTLQSTLAVARLTAVPMLLSMRVIRPAIYVVNTIANGIARVVGLGKVEIEAQIHSADEIGLIAAEAGEAGTLTARERSLILNSLSLGRKTAEQIMVPRVRVAHLDLRKSMDENMRVMNAFLYSRLPLCDGGLDHVIGVVYTKEFLTAFQEPGSDSSVLSLIARPAVFVPVNVALDKLLTAFRERKTHMVFLVDEYGGMEGTVTLTDVVDELVGEMEESSGGQPGDVVAHPATANHPMTISGQTTLRDLAARLNLPTWAAKETIHTVSGLLSERFGRVPAAGEEVVVEGVKLRVVEATRRKVGRVKVTRETPTNVTVP